MQSSSHAQFFTSLKHLEKRLKLEQNNNPSSSSTPSNNVPPTQLHQKTSTDTQQTDSLGTPMYLNCNQSNPNTNPSSDLQESEAPREFLSNSPDPVQDNQPEVEEPVDQSVSDDDDIELLTELLHLSDSDKIAGAFNGGDCDDGFYGKIVGVKGPKSAKEAERLEGWIKHYAKKEPLRLAHLLLAKAAFVHSGDGDDGDQCDGFAGLLFPSTVDEFLHIDPPVE